MSSAPPPTPPPRILVDRIEPTTRGAGIPVKRSLGDVARVTCDVVRDGHDVVRAALIHRPPGAATATEIPLHRDGPDARWADVPLTTLGIHEFEVTAWVDPFASWHDEMERKVAAGQRELAGELAEGAALVTALAEDLDGADRDRAVTLAGVLGSDAPASERAAAALGSDLVGIMSRTRTRREQTHSRPFLIDVDRERARVGVWYELFPRSFGGLAGVVAQLPRLADLGVDVLYLPPIHPIGITHRKGRNNSPTAEPGDVGSPWAIGGAAGGHTAVEPSIGTVDDLEALVRAAARHGIEIALDFAIQCSPDHPWLREHPEWFNRRPDGTLKYAENPPKRYQDIYNVNWDSPDWRGLWAALRDAVLFWVDRGVRIFRVDNPHTKPIGFWEWLIRTVRDGHPDVVFLAEAFTSPARMYALAEAGFSQSYTYFTWKNTAGELADYMRELSSPRVADVFRPNFFANTPDILTEYLQHGGRAAFIARLVLAGTLSPSYGIYSGFENIERTAVAPGSEEYLDSEKYQLRNRTLDGELLPVFRRLNEIRREEASLRRIDLRLLETLNGALLAYAKGTGMGALIVCVNTDPHNAHEGVTDIPWDLDLPDEFTVRDLFSGATYRWHRGHNYVRLDPARFPAHVFRVEP